MPPDQWRPAGARGGVEMGPGVGSREGRVNAFA